MTASTIPEKAGSRKQSLQSGFSLLARGEPKVWFTGGMLVVCLAMITWLLALILYSGLPSFWPQPVDLLTLNDGSLDVGQIQTREKADRNEVVGDGLRRNYRTGNFDFTGRHYRWIEPQDLSQAGIGRSERALVIERLEDGRLYGLPLTVTENILLPYEIRQQVNQLTETDALLGSIPVEDAAIVVEIREAITNKIATLRDSELRKQIDSLPANDAVVWFQNNSGQWQPTDRLDPNDSVLAIRRKWNNDASISQVLPSKVDFTNQLRKQSKRLKHQISQLDGKLSEMRFDVRRAELETDAAAPLVLDSAHYLLEQQVQLETLPERIANYNELLGRSIDTTLASKATELFASFEATELPAQTAANLQQIDLWKQPAADAPDPIREAIDDYQLGFMEIVRSKRPLEEELERLESQLQTLELAVAVPTNTERVDDVSPESLTKLLDGTIDEDLLQKLNSGADELLPQVEVEQLGAHCWLVRAVDVAGQMHLMAVTDSGYIDGDEAQKNLLKPPERAFPISEIVRSVEVNRLSLGQKVGVYLSRWGEFLFDNPREANSEGGVFPAIWGTVVMTLIMTIAVLPSRENRLETSSGEAASMR